MKEFRRETGLVAVLDEDNIDTDAISPTAYLKVAGPFTRKIGAGLFYNKRYDREGNHGPRADFALNQPRYQGASILLTGKNFGCGSSRESAAWALEDYGFRALIAPSFADIFANNALQCGILTIALPEEHVRLLMDTCINTPTFTLTVDLESQQIVNTTADIDLGFEIEPYKKHILVNGLDPIATTLQLEEEIAAYELQRPSWLPSVGV